MKFTKPNRAAGLGLLPCAAGVLAAGLVFLGGCSSKENDRTEEPDIKSTRKEVRKVPIPGADFAPPGGKLVRIPGGRFREVTKEAGIRFRHTNGSFGKKLLPETMGSGVAFLDYDRDGHQDLLFVNS